MSEVLGRQAVGGHQKAVGSKEPRGYQLGGRMRDLRFLDTDIIKGETDSI